MPNDFFRFKQFTIQQVHCAMKVSTDACLFGAWLRFPPTVESIGDIGAGTGLLSLMAAQRFPQARITAIEIDPKAAVEMTENAANSPFRERVEVVCADVKDYTPQKLFDGIISNPPFFKNSLQGPYAARNRARHGEKGFSLKTLCETVARLLKPGGYFALLLPTTADETWEETVAESGLALLRETHVKPFPHREPNRVLRLYQRREEALKTVSDTLCIYERTGVYSAAFTDLLRPFYLNF